MSSIRVSISGSIKDGDNSSVRKNPVATQRARAPDNLLVRGILGESMKTPPHYVLDMSVPTPPTQPQSTETSALLARRRTYQPPSPVVLNAEHPETRSRPRAFTNHSTQTEASAPSSPPEQDSSKIIQIAELQSERVELIRRLDQFDRSNHDQISQLNECRAQIEPLTVELDRYKSLYEEELAAHSRTRANLTERERRVEELEISLQRVQVAHASELSLIREKAAKELEEQRVKYEAQVAERDAKIQKLKHQISENLAGNAVERQQQIDELVKEISRLQQESEHLRSKLKQSLRSGPHAAGAGASDPKQLPALPSLSGAGADAGARGRQAPDAATALHPLPALNANGSPLGARTIPYRR